MKKLFNKLGDRELQNRQKALQRQLETWKQQRAAEYQERQGWPERAPQPLWNRPRDWAERAERQPQKFDEQRQLMDKEQELMKERMKRLLKESEWKEFSEDNLAALNQYTPHRSSRVGLDGMPGYGASAFGPPEFSGPPTAFEPSKSPEPPEFPGSTSAFEG